MSENNLRGAIPTAVLSLDVFLYVRDVGGGVWAPATSQTTVCQHWTCRWLTVCLRCVCSCSSCFSCYFTVHVLTGTVQVGVSFPLQTCSLFPAQNRSRLLCALVKEAVSGCWCRFVDFSSCYFTGTLTPATAYLITTSPFADNCLSTTKNQRTLCDDPFLEISALSDLYTSTSGALWISATYWPQQQFAMCSWQGVTCSSAGHVMYDTSSVGLFARGGGWS